jgi:hypothetical protein
VLLGVKLKYHPYLFPNNWSSYQKQTVGLSFHSVYRYYHLLFVPKWSQ